MSAVHGAGNALPLLRLNSDTNALGGPQPLVAIAMFLRFFSAVALRFHFLQLGILAVPFVRHVVRLVE